jgi:hypothetical protein
MANLHQTAEIDFDTNKKHQKAGFHLNNWDFIHSYQNGAKEENFWQPPPRIKEVNSY